MRVALLILLSAFAAAVGAQNMQPGEWEFVTTMSAPQMPKPQVATVKQCVAKADADDPASFMGQDKSGECQITPGARAPGTYTWTIVCAKRGVEGAGKATYGADKMESEIKMTVTVQQGGQKMEMTNRTVGRRLGACPEK